MALDLKAGESFDSTWRRPVVSLAGGGGTREVDEARQVGANVDAGIVKEAFAF